MEAVSYVSVRIPPDILQHCPMAFIDVEYTNSPVARVQPIVYFVFIL